MVPARSLLPGKVSESGLVCLNEARRGRFAPQDRPSFQGAPECPCPPRIAEGVFRKQPTSSHGPSAERVPRRPCPPRRKVLFPVGRGDPLERPSPIPWRSRSSNRARIRIGLKKWARALARGPLRTNLPTPPFHTPRNPAGLEGDFSRSRWIRPCPSSLEAASPISRSRRPDEVPASSSTSSKDSGPPGNPAFGLQPRARAMATEPLSTTTNGELNPSSSPRPPAATGRLGRPESTPLAIFRHRARRNIRTTSPHFPTALRREGRKISPPRPTGAGDQHPPPSLPLLGAAAAAGYPGGAPPPSARRGRRPVSPLLETSRSHPARKPGFKAVRKFRHMATTNNRPSESLSKQPEG